MSELDRLIAELCPDGVEYKTLEENCEIVRGNGLTKKDLVDTGVGCIHYGQIYTTNFRDCPLFEKKDILAKFGTAYTRREAVQHFTKSVPNSDIAEQSYNLSVSTYVEQEDTREVVDIVALNAEIERIVAREDELRREIGAIIAEIEGV